MRRTTANIVTALLFTFSCAISSEAHTSGQIELTCPVDKTRFKTIVTMSMTQFGSYLDFQKKGAIGSYYEDIVHGCPTCHFCGTDEDFKKRPTDAVVTKVLAELKPVRAGQRPDHVTECIFTAKIYEWEGRKSSEIADQYLIASYLLRSVPASDQERRREVQQLAASYFEKALAASEFSGPTRGSVSYLIAELHRRTGQFDAAQTWFDKTSAEKERPDWLDEVIIKQRKLASEKNADNTI
jgi:uncharacterized protein (DUF2225 family)